jgi:hypothetical protein
MELIAVEQCFHFLKDRSGDEELFVFIPLVERNGRKLDVFHTKNSSY